MATALEATSRDNRPAGDSNIERGLLEVIRKVGLGTSIANVRRLSGGASQDTWTLDTAGAGNAGGVIMRRAFAGERPDAGNLPLEIEAALLREILPQGVPVPEVLHVLSPDDGLGRGYLMRRAPGEALPPKIMRAPELEASRRSFASECGAILARLHNIRLAEDPGLPHRSVAETIDELEAQLRAQDTAPRPVFELAFQWLRSTMPVDVARPSLVHGDFRNGNLLMTSTGIACVLDWEMAHFGHPHEDLGWICVPSWRFGALDKPVGGIGMREDMVAAYVAGGGLAPSDADFRFWEAIGSLRWGITCAGSELWFRTGFDRGAERAVIARRTSECEIDLLRLMNQAERK